MMTSKIMKIITALCVVLTLSLIILAETKYKTWSDLISDLTKENHSVVHLDDNDIWPWVWSYDNSCYYFHNHITHRLCSLGIFYTIVCFRPDV
jgi:uncharacterized protein YxeA